jgi:hypothetical protein
MQDTSVKRVRVIAWVILLLLAAVQGWIFRHKGSPDGVAYLDLSDAVVHGRLGELVNGYWSPLYPAMIGLVRLLVVATPLGAPYWEFAIVHLVNVVTFALSLAAFEWFLRALNAAGAAWGGEQQPFATPGGRAVAYLFFGSASLFMISVEGTVPDYLLSAASFAAFACLLRLRDHPDDRATAIRLGLVLAGGALAKSIMFPLGVVMLVTLALSIGIAETAGRRTAVWVAATFILATLPWCLALSFSLGKPSIGETGTLNYAWYVNNQQPPNTGVMPALAVSHTSLPIDGVAVLSDARGTNPLWYDPVRWHRDVRPRFSPAQQWRHLAVSLRYYLGITAPLLFVLLVLASAAKWRDVLTTMQRSFIVVIPCLAALVAYALVYATARYVAPFIVAAGLTLAAAFPGNATLRASRLALAVSVALLAIDALSPTRGRVFLTYGVALLIPAWLMWRARGSRFQWLLAPLTALGLLWIVATIPILVVRLMALVLGLALWFRHSRSADSADSVVSSPSLRRVLAIAGVVAMVLLNMLSGWHAILRWRQSATGQAHPDWIAAQRMIRDGTPVGSKIAVLGNPESSGWARLARYQIVAVVPERQVDAFLKLSEPDRDRVMRAFADAGATRLIAIPR